MSPFRRDPLRNPELLIRRVYAYVAYRLGDGPDAEDATSETFERAIRYRASYDSSKGEPIAWLLGIARHCVQDAMASRSSVPVELEAEGSETIEEEVVQRLDLADALAELSARDRELIALRYGADLTSRHIGELLELSTNAVEVGLTRARARLSEVLESSAEEPDAESLQGRATSSRRV